MIPKECKRLAEVDFPIAVVSKHSAREKSIRHGHPSTLHLWWARRPLAACRAMLLALLLPDPCDPLCPEEFKTKAKKILLGAPGYNSDLVKRQTKSAEGLRKALLTFIGEVSDWDKANDPSWIGPARELVKSAHPEETPLVVDPFAGGGSIPLEALRLGCEAFASDLNPVACLILKVMLEDIPRHGPELAAELRRVGGEIKKQAEKELAEFYPKDPDGATPIAYLWARTVRCESPNCGAEIPLARSFWLCKKAGRKRALRVAQASSLQNQNGSRQDACATTKFEIFEPKADKEVSDGTVTRAKATCLCCGTVLPPDRVRAQLSEQRGGADVIFDAKGRRTGGARMLAAVTLHPGMQGRNYRLPTEADYLAVWKAQKRLTAILDEWERSGKKGLCPVPDERMDIRGIRHTWIMTYGVTQWKELFNSREKTTLLIFARYIAHPTLSESIRRILTLALDRMVMLMSAHCRWKPSGESLIDMFGRHAIGMVWDYAEASPNQANGSLWESWTQALAKFIEHNGLITVDGGQAVLSDAAHVPLPNESVAIWFTDPPYYDSIAYAHLADCFYVWMKRTLYGLLEQNGDRGSLIAKDEECVVDRPHSLSDSTKDHSYFEAKVAICARDGRRVLTDSGVGCVVFAHKSTEGWESLISGFVRAGWAITASWPIATELSTRLNARDTASLATSVHLVCRPRTEDAPVGDWGEVLRELPKRVGDWMERLQNEGVRGADLVFACIGPALEIFSRYCKVETAEGREVKLAEYLAKVWEVVGRTALEQILGTAEAKARNGAAGALEEDARLTALFLWTLQSTNGKDEGGMMTDESAEDESDAPEDEDAETPKGKPKGFSLVFDVARRFAQPLGIELPKWEGRIVETKKGVVRLLAVSERAKQLFGDEGAKNVAFRLEQEAAYDPQQLLFPELTEQPIPRIRGRRGRVVHEPGNAEMTTGKAATTLDRVHAAMLLQAGGQSNALRALIKAEAERGQEFLRLANALSALYPSGSEEKRLLDAMLLAAPR